MDTRHYVNIEKWKIRAVAFCVGLVCGVVLMITQPWDREAGSRINKAALAAGEADTTLELEAGKHEKAAVTISYLQELTQDASDLVTTRYYYTDADTYSNTKQLGDFNIPFTTTEYVYTYKGTISLGIDVSRIGFSVDNTHERIEVSMPDVKIIANEIDADSFTYYSSKTTVFNMTQMADITDLIAALKTAKADKVMADDELLADAQSRAEEVIASLIAKSDLAGEYEVVFK